MTPLCLKMYARGSRCCAHIAQSAMARMGMLAVMPMLMWPTGGEGDWKGSVKTEVFGLVPLRSSCARLRAARLCGRGTFNCSHTVRELIIHAASFWYTRV